MTGSSKGADKSAEERVRLFELLLRRVGIDLPPAETMPGRAEPDRAILARAQEQTRSKMAWFHFPKQCKEARLRLFCFPYAGGGAAIFHKWAESLPVEVDVCSVQLPGRGARFSEAPFTQIDPLVETIARNILAYADKPFAFWGHSLGALLGFEVARSLSRQYGLEPARLFVSGCAAPQARASFYRVDGLSESQLLDELRRLGGTPEAILANPELMQLLVSALKADFELSRTYRYKSGPPLSCPITAYGGLEDPIVGPDAVKAWRHQTRAPFSLHMFRGGHFFMHTAEPALLDVLSRHLRQAL
jgi:medium-chain acyl-[acyl-carrier-protein] hydrolase